MEIAGGVASIIAIVDLAAKLTKVCAKYISEVREYETEVKDLRDKIQSLGTVLGKLDGLLKGPHRRKLETSAQLQSSLLDCKNELQNLLNRLRSPPSATAALVTGIGRPPTENSKWSRRFLDPLMKTLRKKAASNTAEALIWPIQKAEVGKIISRLENAEDVIRFALQVDQAKLILDVDVKLNLVNLPVAEGASFGWYGDDHEPKCLSNTREELLKEVENWVNGTSSKHMFWLSGAAGTGKSTIARTVAEKYKRTGVLGASFFFRRGAGDRANASKFFTTLATNLMQHIPATRLSISEAIEKQPDLPRSILKEQFDKLIFEPLSLVSYSGPIVLVVDALDECDNEKDVLTIVKLLGLMKTLHGIDVRLFITSRHEVFINAGFQHISGDFQDLILHDIEERKILHDITVFFEHELARIKAEHMYSDTLPLDWPTHPIIETLASMACPLFIVASTICRFIEEPETLPGDQLTEILESQKGLVDFNPENSLGLTYLHILKQRVKNKSPSKIQAILEDFQSIIGPIVLLQSPLPRASLSQLIDMEEAKVQVRLDGFQSVLHIPSNPDDVIKTFHLSFREFLLDPQTKNKSPLWIDERLVHTLIARRSLIIMKKHLRKNLCDLPSPDCYRDEISSETIQKKYPQELQYACRYWAHHIVKSQQNIYDGSEAHLFLLEYILELLEAMAILKFDIATILELEPAIQKESGSELSKLLYDVRRFIQFHHYLISSHPLQIYHSALYFSPRASFLRQKFYSTHLDWVQKGPKVPAAWGSLQRTIDLGESHVKSVEFTPNGESVIVRNFNDISLWDSKTGALMSNEPNLKGPLIYSPDCVWRAQMAMMHSIVISDTSTGLEVAKLCIPQRNLGYGPRHEVTHTPVVFSHNGKRLLSFKNVPDGDYVKNPVLVWDTGNWELLYSWQDPETDGSGYCYEDGMFSSNDDFLVISYTYTRKVDSDDRFIITVLDIGSGSGVVTQSFDRNAIFTLNRVKFSPDGQYLIYITRSDLGSWALVVAHFSEGEFQRVFEFTRKVPRFSPGTVVFLPNEQFAVLDPSRPASGIEVWSIRSRNLVQVFGTDMHVSGVLGMSLSPDGKILATYGEDYCVKLWDRPWLEKPNVPVEAHGKALVFLALSKSGCFGASAEYANSEIVIWQVLSENVEFHSRLDIGSPMPRSNMSFGIFSDDDKFFAAACIQKRGIFDAGLWVWNVESGERIHQFKNTFGLELITFSPGNKFLAVTIKLLDLTSDPPMLPPDELLLIFDLQSRGEPVVLNLDLPDTIRRSRFQSNEPSFYFLVFSTESDIIALVARPHCMLWTVGDWVEIKCPQERCWTVNDPFTPPLESFSQENRSFGKLPPLSPTSRWLKFSYTCDIDGETVSGEARFDLSTVESVCRDIGTGAAAWRDGWIAQNGVGALWVPSEYRGRDEFCSQIRGDTIAVGNGGGFEIWKFKSPIA
ncbi:hypothetical protein TWF730_003535 [Orbilia blumenaviensis]|uniref:NACHT domain-containing protein n=1 Tax=Orbilia blumenaviensis TaxID=1796055 RepID=A0AAV9U2Q9_9PEZI